MNKKKCSNCKNHPSQVDRDMLKCDICILETYESEGRNEYSEWEEVTKENTLRTTY